MADLKLCFEQNGFQDVLTYIQSGNVIFESDEKSSAKLEKTIETALSKRFNYAAKVMIRSKDEVDRVLEEVPASWKNGEDLRCYIAFIKESLTAQEAKQEIPVKEGVDFLDAGKGVLYMSTILSGLTKSAFGKMIGKKIYQHMTMRNYATTQKIGALME